MDLQGSGDRVRALETQVGLLRDREAANRAQRSLTAGAGPGAAAAAGRNLSSRPHPSRAHTRTPHTASSRGEIRADIDREFERDGGSGGLDATSQSYRSLVAEEEEVLRSSRERDGAGVGVGVGASANAGVMGPTHHWSRREKQAARDSARSASAGSDGSAGSSRSNSRTRGAGGGGGGRGGEWSSTKWLASSSKYPDSDGGGSADRVSGRSGVNSDSEMGRHWASFKTGGSSSGGAARAGAGAVSGAGRGAHGPRGGPLTSRSLEVTPHALHALAPTPSDRASLTHLQAVYARVTSASAGGGGGARSSHSKTSANSSWVDSDSDSDD